MIAHLLQIDGLSKIIDNLSIVASIAFRFCAHGCGQFLSCSLKTSVYRLDQHTIIVYLIGLELMKGSNLGLVDVPKNARPLELVAESEPAPGGSWQAAFIDDGKNTIASQLVERLREAIVSGQLEAGAKINLLRAREIFSVSLSPLREALARLIPDGLVTFEDNRGYRVAPVSVSNLREITRLRQEFETLALRQAIASAPPEWEGDVMRALHRLNTAERNAADPATLEHWEALHRDFHLSLLSGCGMPLLLGFCRTLLNLNDRYRRSFLVSTSGDRNVGMEHSEIAQGAAARDAEFACARLREHIHRTGSNLASHLADRIAP